MSVCPCGATMGHGESCVEGYLCKPCREIERLRNSLPMQEIERLRAELESLYVERHLFAQQSALHQAQLADTAAFLDRHADLIMKWPVVEHWKEAAADECRAEAKKLRGETS